MSELRIEEKCPCGGSINAYGYAASVTQQVIIWHKLHDKHANEIAKALATKKTSGPFDLGATWDGANNLRSSVGDFADQRVEGSR